MVGALAAAFDGDPPLQWFLPDARRRRGRLEHYFGAMLPLYLQHGRVWTSDDVACGAAWAAPGAWPFGLRDELRVTPAMLRVFGRHPVRALKGQRTVLSGHPQAPHWFLDYIGVEPSAHGRGTGSALLRPMLEAIDSEGRAAYLNAGSARSRDLYRRHGFEVTEEFRLPLNGPPLWRMWREPATE